MEVFLLGQGLNMSSEQKIVTRCIYTHNFRANAYIHMGAQKLFGGCYCTSCDDKLYAVYSVVSFACVCCHALTNALVNAF